MLFARRLTAIRVAALVAVLASTLLVVDTVQAGREFCPLEEACSAAAQSELGSIFGIPTSVLGLGAFAAVMLITLLPVRIARTLLQPLCFAGALAAMALIAYQAMHLDAFCPLCLVADGAAIVLGYLALTWAPLPILRSNRSFRAETTAARTAWGLALALAMVAPFAWPRAEDPGWEEAPEMADALFEDAGPDVPREVAATPPAPVPAADRATELPSLPTAPTTAAEPILDDAPATAVLASPATDVVEDPPADPQPATVELVPTLAPAPALVVPPRTPPPAVERTQEGVRVVEYLNAFCAHCRATHARLEKVLEHGRVPVERRRVYTWNGSGYPLWARACVYAATVGREEAMFRELTRARRESAAEIYAAARRAGVDGPAFRRALTAHEPPPRLVRDKRIARTARLQRLPTFDIGRRRLSGSQSERELRAALQAAARPTPSTNG